MLTGWGLVLRHQATAIHVSAFPPRSLARDPPLTLTLILPFPPPTFCLQGKAAETEKKELAKETLKEKLKEKKEAEKTQRDKNNSKDKEGAGIATLLAALAAANTGTRYIIKTLVCTLCICPLQPMVSSRAQEKDFEIFKKDKELALLTATIESSNEKKSVEIWCATA